MTPTEKFRIAVILFAVIMVLASVSDVFAQEEVELTDHAVSQFDITFDNDGTETQYVNGGYEKDVDDNWTLGARQGIFHISDNDGSETFNHSMFTYERTDADTFLLGSVGSFYNSNWDLLTYDITGGWFDDKWYVEGSFYHGFVESTLAIDEEITGDSYTVSVSYTHLTLPTICSV